MAQGENVSFVPRLRHFFLDSCGKCYFIYILICVHKMWVVSEPSNILWFSSRRYVKDVYFCVYTQKMFHLLHLN